MLLEPSANTHMYCICLNIYYKAIITLSHLLDVFTPFLERANASPYSRKEVHLNGILATTNLRKLFPFGELAWAGLDWRWHRIFNPFRNAWIYSRLSIPYSIIFTTRNWSYLSYSRFCLCSMVIVNHHKMKCVGWFKLLKTFTLVYILLQYIAVPVYHNYNLFIS